MLIALVFFVIYLLMLLQMNIAWHRLPLREKNSIKHLKVSVVIPFRNEAAHLQQLVDDLNRQSYPDFEVLFVNDHSTDQGEERLSLLLEKYNLPGRVLHLKEKEGKKMAISHGIESSSAQIIVTTDADCRFSTHWLETIMYAFQDPLVQMVSGPVYLFGSSFWQRMQALEFSALIGVSGALLYLNKPTMSNGANLAYRKKAFRAVGGFDLIDAIPSGDDELLMDKFYRQKNYRIVFVKEKEAWVRTSALATFKDFKNQRLRWAGKWALKKRFNTIFTSIFVFLVQALQVFLIYTFIDSWKEWEGITAGAFMLLRGIMEYNFIKSVRKSHDSNTSSLVFTVCYLIYPLYVLYFGVASNFEQFEWKGRIYDR